MMANEPEVKASEPEEAYRSKYYHDFRVVSERQLTCASCGNEVSSISGNVFSHPILGVLQCKTCLDKYKDFKSKKDRCILCGNHSSFKCRDHSCPHEYCRKCIKRNVNHCIKEAEKDDWECFACNPKPFWELRGVCAAVMSSLSKRTKPSRHTSRERSQDFTSERVKQSKKMSPFLNKELRKSKRTLRTLQSLCDDSDDNRREAHRPLFHKGMNDFEEASEDSRLSPPAGKWTRTSKHLSSRNIIKSPTSSSNSSSYFQKSKCERREKSKIKRKLYSQPMEDLEVTPADTSSDEAHEKEQKIASLRFKHHFSIIFENTKAALSEMSTAVDKCETQCLRKENIKDEDALELKNRFKKILLNLRMETAEKCKEVDETYKSWHKNFGSCFRTKNGFSEKKKRLTSSSTGEENPEKDIVNRKELGKEIEIENNENGIVSECDSDAIFSSNESRKKSNRKKTISEDSESETSSKKSSLRDGNSRSRSSDKNCTPSAERSLRRSSTERNPSESSQDSAKENSNKFAKTNSEEKKKLKAPDTNSSRGSGSEEAASDNKKSCIQNNVETEKRPELEIEEEEAKKNLLLSDSDDAQRSTPASEVDSIKSCSTILTNLGSAVGGDTPEINQSANAGSPEINQSANADSPEINQSANADSPEINQSVNANSTSLNNCNVKNGNKNLTNDLREKESNENKSESDCGKRKSNSNSFSDISEKVSNARNANKKEATKEKKISKKILSPSESEEARELDILNGSESEKNLNERAKKNLLNSSSDLSLEEEERVSNSDNNKRAKRNLLDSSSSEESPDLFTSLEEKPSKRKRNKSDSENSESCRLQRRKRFKLSKNQYYRADKKLRMSCRVELKRLSRMVLRKHAKALQRSKQHLEKEKLKSLVSLDNLERTRKKGPVVDSSGEDSDTEIKSRNHKKKTPKGSNETVLDHLKKVGNADVDTQADSRDSEERSSEKIKSKKNMTNDQLFDEANKRAKQMLLNSDSDIGEENDLLDDTDSGNKNKKQTDEENEKSEDKESEDKKKNLVKMNDSENDSEDKEEKEKRKEKLKWKQDKILQLRISDSDSEKEKEKIEKRQKKSKAKKTDKGSTSNEDELTIVKVKKKRTKRKILDSDSDVKITDLSDSDKSSGSDVKVKEESTSRKRGAKKTSDSDSSFENKKSRVKRKRIKAARESDSDSEPATNSQSSPLKGGRKNIRKVLKDKQVAEDTKQAAKEEEERLKRIAERQKVYNEVYEMRLAGEEKVQKLVLDFDETTKEELVSVHKDLVNRLKPHQAQGIKFMWDACFESVERAKTSKGSGCIIAHCMGLGKTFQIVTLVHTLLTHEEIGVKTVLVVCPLSTALNWAGEFEMWLKDLDNYDDINIYELGRYKQNCERRYQLEHWRKHGGVCIIGYDMFRNLTGNGKKMRKSMRETILECLVDPGPDVIVCDEGHLLKNEDTALSKSMRKVKTLRRIVLTGTPLQNNLVEYHCMVQFVKPNLLGTKKEFSNRFVNPIKNGSTADATAYDVKLMKKRAFILHNLLEGSVQRFDYSVLTPFLPPKQEYVISVKLTPLQIQLYQHYLDNFSRGTTGGPRIFPDYHALQRICTHPVVMKMNADKMEKKRQNAETDSEGSLKDFVVNDSDTSEGSSEEAKTGSDVQCVDSDNEVSAKKRRGTRANPITEPVDVEPEISEPREWWSDMIQPEHLEDVRISAKLVLLFEILKESEQIGDKVLVFSQSLYSLTLIEQFLSKIDEASQNSKTSELLDNHTGSWSLGLDYFRLDGQTSAENRSQWCKIFNRPTNTRARLFLISTRAGGLGINLTAANRVIIFDASWNPSHDVQSIFRIYRFGQKKPCYIYRFLAKGTMEEKIYNRQVSKLSLSCRVIDEQQIERHFNTSDLAELYSFDPNPPRESETLKLPRDHLLADIFLKYNDLIHNYHEHDSLLENKLDEVLNEEDRKIAWQEYEDEKKGRPVVNFAQVNPYGLNPAFFNQILLNGQTNFNQEIEHMINFYMKDFPTLNMDQLRQMAQNNIAGMYNYVEGQAFNRNNPNQYLAQQYAPLLHQHQQQQMQQQLLKQQQQPQQAAAQQTQQQFSQQLRQQNMLRLLQQQQERFAQMPAAGISPAVIDLASPQNSQEE